MSNNEVIINQKEHSDIYNWLGQNIYDYKDKHLCYRNIQEYFTLTSEGKINAYCDVRLYVELTQIKYPFGYVSGDFSCSGCINLTSLINSPEKIDGFFIYMACDSLISIIGFPKHIKGDIAFVNNKFSNKPKDKEEYKLYLAMWLELLESVSNEDRKEYITNYKYKNDWREYQPIIPIEIMKEYGF